MRGVSYYRIMIALPVVGTLLAILFIALFRDWMFLRGLFALLGAGWNDAGPENTVGLILLLAFLSPVTLACLTVLPALLLRLRGQPEAAYRRSSKRAPLWIGATTFVMSSVAFLVTFDSDSDVILAALVVGVISVVLGYVYAGFAAILLGMLRTISLVKPVSDTTVPVNKQRTPD